MGLLKKKKRVDDDWIICDEEYLSPESESETRAMSKEKSKRKQKTPKKAKRENVPDEYNEEIDYLTSDYMYDATDDMKRINIWCVVSVISILAVFLIGLIGYNNTDFDKNGNAYIIPLELHYERRYVKQSDKVLEDIISIAESINEDAEHLVGNYIYLSTKLNEEVESLKANATELSRYIGVPTNMDSYHSSILNFSIKTQNFIMTLLTNYTHEDFIAFKDKGVYDLETELSTLINFRRQIDEEIFRNME